MKIILCGFMGCGKTSVGELLARKLEARFVDMDRYIEERQGKTVSQIFQEQGEAAFRACEREAAKELMQLESAVIASGGGTVLDPGNVAAFHQGGGEIYFLDVPVAALQERLKRDTRRPLLQRPDRREFIEALYRERRPKYLAAADRVVDAGAPAAWLAAKLAQEIKNRENSPKLQYQIGQGRKDHQKTGN